MEKTAFLIGKTTYLRKLTPADINENYLGWLNDEEVLEFSTRKVFPTGMEALQKYYESLQTNPDLYLAICMKDSKKHVGNLSLNTLQWLHRSAELSIMVGDKSVWGKGVASDAIKTIVRHGFQTMNLHRIWAESPNPSFNAVMAKLGWTKEGIKRSAFFHKGKYVDFECWSLLENEWKP